MAPYLSQEQVNTLVEAAQACRLFRPDLRDLLLSGIQVGFAATLTERTDPLNQLRSDILEMNTVPYLVGGEVPLRTWLENALAQVRMSNRPQQAVFQEMLNLVADESQRRLGQDAGVPPPGVPGPNAGLEQIIHQDDLLSYGWLRGALAAGNSVARLVVPRFEDGEQVFMPGGAPWLSKGTGWLIGQQYVITNHHVINARADSEGDAPDADLRLQAKHTRVEFAYDAEDAAPDVVEVEELAAWFPRFAQPALDFAILKLEQPAARPALTLAPGSLKLLGANKLPVNIIQHPKGNPKMIGVRNNLVASLEDIELRYFTDTERGSSGSPVCDDAWHVVALHRANVYLNKNVNFQGKDTAWANRGVRVDRIIEHLKTQHPDLWAAIGAKVV